MELTSAVLHKWVPLAEIIKAVGAPPKFYGKERKMGNPYIDTCDWSRYTRPVL